MNVFCTFNFNTEAASLGLFTLGYFMWKHIWNGLLSDHTNYFRRWFAAYSRCSRVSVNASSRWNHNTLPYVNFLSYKTQYKKVWHSAILIPGSQSQAFGDQTVSTYLHVECTWRTTQWLEGETNICFSNWVWKENHSIIFNYHLSWWAITSTFYQNPQLSSNIVNIRLCWTVSFQYL